MRRRPNVLLLAFCLIAFSAMDGVEGEFEAIRRAQLVVDAKQVVAHGVFTQLQMPGDVAIGQSFGYEVDDVLLSPRERISGFRSF